jgi:hypothetical protein
MDEAAEHADQVLVLERGMVAAHGGAGEVFSDTELLDRVGLRPPTTVALVEALRARGVPVPGSVATRSECVTAVLEAFAGGRA